MSLKKQRNLKPLLQLIKNRNIKNGCVALRIFLTSELHRRKTLASRSGNFPCRLKKHCHQLGWRLGAHTSKLNAWKEIKTVPVWNRVLDVQVNALSYPAQVRIKMYIRVYAHTHRAAHTHYKKTSLRIHSINSVPHSGCNLYSGSDSSTSMYFT